MQIIDRRLHSTGSGITSGGDWENRSGWIKWYNTAGIVIVSLTVVALVLWISRMRRDEIFAEKNVEARRHLQLNQNEDALAVLTSVDSTDAPGEFRYLKALALDRLSRHEAANSEIRQAIEAAPENPKFKALELRFRLFARERAAMDQLVELNRDYASVAAVALFATYGFQAKAVLLETEGKRKAATYHHQRREQTLDTALTLSSEITELYPELLRFAVRNQKQEAALELVNELLELDAESLELRNTKVATLCALKRVDEAVPMAERLYEDTGKKPEGAAYLAAVLAQASDTKKHDARLRELHELYPRSVQILSKYSVYLTRTGRLMAAWKILDDAIGKQSRAEDKEALAFVAITLALEINAPDQAIERLREYRKYLTDDLLADYFEARILYLQKRYGPAVRRMVQILKTSKERPASSQAFTAEALSWIQRILSEKVLAEQMQVVMRTATTSGDDQKIKVQVAEDDEADETSPASEGGKPGAGSKSSSPGSDTPAGKPTP